MAEIIIQPLVHYKLTKLLKAIHHAKYFGTKAGAKTYVNLLITFIEASIRVFDRHGERVSRHKARIKYLINKIFINHGFSVI